MVVTGTGTKVVMVVMVVMAVEVEVEVEMMEIVRGSQLGRQICLVFL